jgi:hypothetical protein
MDHTTPPFGEARRITGKGAPTANAAAHIARERQKQELRRERDAIVLAIGRDLGEAGMAERLGLTRPVVHKLLAGARERVDGAGSSPTPAAIAARRLPVDGERWAWADAHYEALGSGPALRDHRATSSTSSTPAR